MNMVNMNDLKVVEDYILDRNATPKCSMAGLLVEYGMVGCRSVLDLGCGHGWSTDIALAFNPSKVVGIDSSSLMLDKARERIVNECLCWNN